MSQKKLGYNILLWAGLYFIWILVFQKRAFAFSRTMTVEFCYLLFVAANFYFNIYFTIPHFLYRKRYGWFALLFIAGIIAAAFLRVPLATWLSQHYFAPGKLPPAASELFFNSLTNIFVWVISLVGLKLMFDRIRFQKYIDGVEKEKIRTELDFLKAQFNPHFLFNSINSIYGNIDKHNSTARHMLLTFSEMLRYQLYECNTDSIFIEKEIKYIRNYVALQESRKSDNLKISMRLENLEGFTIAPFLFITFIENAFKYVSHFENKLNIIHIMLTRDNDNLVFFASNTKENLNGHTVTDHHGIGIVNVKRRLELLYPGRHELKLNSTENHYEVSLNIRL